LRSPLSTVPAWTFRPDSAATLTTTALDRSSLQWLGIDS